MDCLFCKIASKEIPAKIIYEDDQVVAFEDITPKAPHHKLVIPKKHIATLNDSTQEDTALLGHMMQTLVAVAKKIGIAEDGYRIVANCNSGAGQTVFHIHMHLLGGRSMTWPPG